ncbi:MAG: hypothetical protein ACHP7O_13380 [Burkholderiales bacterium]
MKDNTAVVSTKRKRRPPYRAAAHIPPFCAVTPSPADIIARVHERHKVALVSNNLRRAAELYINAALNKKFSRMHGGTFEFSISAKSVLSMASLPKFHTKFRLGFYPNKNVFRYMPKKLLTKEGGIDSAMAFSTAMRNLIGEWDSAMLTGMFEEVRKYIDETLMAQVGEILSSELQELKFSADERYPIAPATLASSIVNITKRINALPATEPPYRNPTSWSHESPVLLNV